MFERLLNIGQELRAGRSKWQTRRCNMPQGLYMVELLTLKTAEGAIHSYVFECTATAVHRGENLVSRRIFRCRNCLESPSVRRALPCAQCISRKLCQVQKRERGNRAFLGVRLGHQLDFESACYFNVGCRQESTLLILFAGKHTTAGHDLV